MVLHRLLRALYKLLHLFLSTICTQVRQISLVKEKDAEGSSNLASWIDREGTQTQNCCYITQCSDIYSPACLAMVLHKEAPPWLLVICPNFLGPAVSEVGVPLVLPVSSLTTMCKCVADAIRALPISPWILPFLCMLSQ